MSAGRGRLRLQGRRMRLPAVACAGLLLALSALSCGEQDVVVASLSETIDSGSRRDASIPERDSASEAALTDRVDGGADAPSLDDGGGHWCSNDQDCPAAFCAKSSCGASHGRCQAPPFNCDDGFDPVCGCDGVTYWNDCLRQQHGVSVRTMGQCSTYFVVCDGGADNPSCPAPASCGKLDTGFSGACDPESPGVCWVLPETCPQDAGAPQW